ncbi:MAG: glutamate--cysteine ligase [Casimicrobiaceae bacterium]
MLDPARLAALSPSTLAGLRRGIEKESLRVRPDGKLAITPHPAPLGSALTHPSVTTDFSESQLELITGVHATPEACIAEITEIHQVVYRAIGDELLWASSMPCQLPADDAIPIGRYGTSNVGRTKSVYRQGLSYRYGRRMQTISGIHYNFSLPEAVSNDTYFALIRNFRRHSWLLLYLFGASPAVCSSFVASREHELQTLSADTLYLPYATSLRMGRLGYQSDAQSSLQVSYNCLDSYAESLHGAMTRPYPAYQKYGIRQGDDYHQLATSLLQIENEFYSTIRPKRRIRPGERPLHALRQRGVEYVEVRLMDLDPFEAVGIDAATMRLLDVFLLHCMLSDSPPDNAQELAAVVSNQQRVASRGREPGLKLTRGIAEVSLFEWAAQILAECEPIAAALDAAGAALPPNSEESAALAKAAHRNVLAGAVATLRDPELSPSAQVLQSMTRDFDNSHTRFALTQSVLHRDAIWKLPFARDIADRYGRLAEGSLVKQRQIEAADSESFEVYLERYLAPERLTA